MHLTIRHWRRVCAALAILICSCHKTPPPSTSPEPALHVPPGDARVVIFVIDGPRWTECFGDSTHAHIPGMWNTLRPQGTVCTNFRNEGWTLTIPGHGTMLTGIWQHLNNQGLERPKQPTLFEYYRKEKNAPAQDALIVSMKEKLGAVAYSVDSTEYGSRYGASVELGDTNDVETYHHLIQHLDRDSPHIVLASFSQTDLAGHANDWKGYLRHIEIADSLAVLTWNHLQANPAYAGKTYMFITADHGRHDDAHGGFQNHGDECEGCRHIPFLALGPGIKTNYMTSTHHTQQDICKMVARLLGITADQAQGEPFDDIFQGPASTWSHDPSIYR
jgi:hypothetical protein